MPVKLVKNPLCQVGLCWSHNCGHQSMAKLGEPGHRKVDQDPFGGVTVKTKNHLDPKWLSLTESLLSNWSEIRSVGSLKQ